MNNADRILRVVYKDADIASLFTWPLSCLVDKRIMAGMYQRYVYGCFYLDPENHPPCCGQQWSKNYINLITQSYLKCYPHNYQQDETELIIREQVMQVKEVFPSSGTNAALMFPYYANKLFAVKNKELYVKFEDLLEWNGFINKVDMNIFYSAFDAMHERDNASSLTYIPKHTDTRINSILEKGYAETHMHLNGSGYTPEINWYYYIRDSSYHVGKVITKIKNFVELFWEDKNPQTQDYIALAFQKLPIIRNLLQVRIKGSEKSKREIIAEELLEKVFYIQDEFQLLILRESKEYQELACEFEYQIKQSSFEDPKDYVTFEQVFLKAIFRKLLDNRLSPLDLYAFNGYLAALTQFKFCVSQDNFGMGFTKFKRAEDNKEYFCNTREAKEALYCSVFDKYYRDGGLKKAELRIAPKKKRAFIKLIDRLENANEKAFRFHCCRLGIDSSNQSQVEKIEYRLIVHFIRDNAPCSTKAGEARKQKLMHTTAREFRKIEKLLELEDVPELGKSFYKNKLAAIDAANYEINCRPENFAPLFRKFIYEIAPYNEVSLTYHAGEDFLTLCNGLRAIDEVLELMEFHRGNRLGHALALGLDVDRYFHTKRGYIITSLQDHLDDLVWMHKLISEYKHHEVSLLEFLESQYQKHARGLFRRETMAATNAIPSIYDYALSLALRGNDPHLYAPGEPPDPLIGERKRYRDQEACLADCTEAVRNLFRDYHFSERIKTNGNKEVIEEAHKEYIRALKCAQSIVRKKVYSNGIAIETNPTSNRKISMVEKYIDLPILAFNHHNLSIPEKSNTMDDRNIPITINTDDSAIFQTNLSNEYVLVAAALYREGFDWEEVCQYIDYLRELSLQYCFVR